MTSTLALKKADFESEVGEFMGWGRGTVDGDPAWSTQKTTIIKMDVKSGLRRFYFNGHPWTFLNPMATLILPSGNTTIRLPDDFGGVDGGTQILVMDSNGGRIGILSLTGPGRVEQMYLDQSSTGSPRMIAQRPLKGQNIGKMQASEMVVYPTADQDYTLKFHYFFTPDYLLDVAQPYAAGGVEHHETIMECCLAVAEARRDNTLTVHASEAQRLLEQSIRLDRRRQPKKLGYNRDHSDRIDDQHWNDWNDHGLSNSSGVIINGVQYD